MRVAAVTKFTKGLVADARPESLIVMRMGRTVQIDCSSCASQLDAYWVVLNGS